MARKELTRRGIDWRPPEQRENSDRYDWLKHARPSQLAPESDWRVWLLLAGRGFGKSRCGAEWVRQQIESGRCKRMALVAPTAADARDVMVEGESGLLAICPPWNRPHYEPSKRRLTWPNGGAAALYSADEPDRLRGPQFDGAWCDEIASWKYPEAWDMLQFGLRLGTDPRCVVTTTPRPTPLVKQLRQAATTTLTTGTSYENRENLAPAFFEQIVARYEGTRLGRQELLAEVLEDNPFALWKREWIEQTRIETAPACARIVVGVDPAAASGETAAEAGIVICGQLRDQFFVLGDRTTRGTPRDWARAAITAYQEFGADRIIAEVNNGGEMVEETLRAVDRSIGYRAVRASRGKMIRAEPISALYEKGQVHHVGTYPSLEDQLTDWVPGDPSPDRLDALVWALTELSAGTGFYIPGAAAGPSKGISDNPLGRMR